MLKFPLKILYPHRDADYHQSLNSRCYVARECIPLKSFTKYRRQLFELSCCQTDKHTKAKEYNTH